MMPPASTRTPRTGAPPRGVPLARALGWFNVGLGVAAMLMSRGAVGASGAFGHSGDVSARRWAGVRKFATGVGLLLARDPTPWVWMRIAADSVDLAALASTAAERPRGRAATCAVAGILAVELKCAATLMAERDASRERVLEYGERRGLPLPASEMRGAARDDFIPPADMVTPLALRPYGLH